MKQIGVIESLSTLERWGIFTEEESFEVGQKESVGPFDLRLLGGDKSWNQGSGGGHDMEGVV